MSHFTAESIIGVIGAGTMGAGIAQVAAKAGHQVLLFDAMDGAASKGRDNIRSGLARLVTKGKMSQQDVDALVNRVSVIGNLQEMAPAALVVEAIVERLDIKQQVFSELESICSEHTILASNTSSISLTAIGAKLKRPQNLVGMHFFNPAPVMKLVEVISGLDTSPSVADAIFNLSNSWGKKPVHAKSTPGFIVNRVARPFYAEGMRIAQEGAADIATIDALLKQSGSFRMGPFELMDLIGHDVNYAVTRSVFDAYYQDQRFLPSLLQLELVNAGHLGRKTGKGFYDYSDSSTKALPHTAQPGPRPENIIVEGNLGPAAELIPLFEQAGIKVDQHNDGDGSIRIGDTVIKLTNGQFATQRASSNRTPNFIHFDLALNYSSATRIALSPADQANDKAIAAATGLFQALGKDVSIIDDIPGMAVMRTVSMLANEGFDAVNQGVCSEEAVDIAMQGGVNYPCGPITWAQKIGLANVASVLDNLAQSYGEDRYRCSPLLRRKVAGGQ